MRWWRPSGGSTWWWSTPAEESCSHASPPGGACLIWSASWCFPRSCLLSNTWSVNSSSRWTVISVSQLSNSPARKLNLTISNIPPFYLSSSSTTVILCTGTWRQRMFSTPTLTASKWETLVSACSVAPVTTSTRSVALHLTPPQSSSRGGAIQVDMWICGHWASCFTSWWPPPCHSKLQTPEDWNVASCRAPTPSPPTYLHPARRSSRASWGRCLLIASRWHRSCPVTGWEESSTPRRIPPTAPHPHIWPSPPASSALTNYMWRQSWRTWASPELTSSTTAWTWGAPSAGPTRLYCIASRRGDVRTSRAWRNLRTDSNGEWTQTQRWINATLLSVSSCSRLEHVLLLSLLPKRLMWQFVSVWRWSQEAKLIWSKG